MLAAAEAIEQQILVRPIQIGVRQSTLVVLRAPPAAAYTVALPCSRINSENPRLRPLAQQGPHDAVIEKQTRIQIVAEVDPEFEAAFLHHVPFGNALALLVLLAALLRLAHPRVHMRTGTDRLPATPPTPRGGARGRFPDSRSWAEHIPAHTHAASLAPYRSMAKAYSGMSASYTRKQSMRSRAAHGSSLQILAQSIGEHLRARPARPIRAHLFGGRCSLASFNSKRSRRHSMVPLKSDGCVWHRSRDCAPAADCP
jgi:hypothetical protein